MCTVKKNAKMLATVLCFVLSDGDPTAIGYRGTSLRLGDDFSRVSKLFGGLAADPNGAHWNSRIRHDYVTFITGVNGEDINATVACSFENDRLCYFSVSYLFVSLRAPINFQKAKKMIGKNELDDISKARSVFRIEGDGIRREICFDSTSIMPYVRFTIEKIN
jgi:hypothetical protein